MVNQRNKQKKEEAERKGGERGEGNRKDKKKKTVNKNRLRLQAGGDVTHISNNFIVDLQNIWTQKLSSHIQ